MATIRGEITSETVAAALKMAAPGSDAITEFADTRIPGFILRVRGAAVTWMYRTRTASKKLGAPPKVGVREARRLAEEARSDRTIAPAEKVSVDPSESVWTWGEVSKAYLEHISSPRMKGNNEKKPSPDTVVDATRAMGRPALASLQEIPVTSLEPLHLIDAVRETIDGVSYPQARKMFAYVKSALTFVLSNHARESGLKVAWWTAVRMPEPSGEIVAKIVARKRPTAVEGFGLKQVADVLARHEDYCRGRTGNERVSPAVRWGLWWYALTVVRSGAATKLELSDVTFDDPLLPDGWALAKWSDEKMKGDKPHWLPIPPIGIRILECVRRDWRAAVNLTHGAAHDSKWYFPSNRRVGKNPDPCITESGLSLHIKVLRGKRPGHHRDLLKGIPHFTPHSLRSAAASYLLDRVDIEEIAASAFLSHTLRVDPTVETMSPTTRTYYDRAQRMTSKTSAITAWSEALMSEYKKIGGIEPT